MEKRFGFKLHFIILFLILIIVFYVIFSSLESIKYLTESDEGYYLKYASYIAESGPGGFKHLFLEYINNEESWVYPSPLRIFYILLSSLFLKIFGHTFLSLAYLSIFSYILFIIANYYFSSKYFSRTTTFLFTLLIAFSPLSMAMSRRALSESLSTFLLALSIWLFLDILHSNKFSFKKHLFAIIFALAILTKESSILLLLPFWAYLFLYKFKYNHKLELRSLAIVFIYSFAVVFFAYLFFLGGLSNIISTMKIVLTSPATNNYAILYGSGPWFRYIIDYMLISPWTALMAIGYIFYLALNFDRSGKKDIYFLVILVGLFVSFNIFTKNIRYAMILDIPIRLFTIFMLYKLAPIKNNRVKNAVVITAILLICTTDLIFFKNLFIEKDLYDPMSDYLLRIRHIIP